MKNPDIPICDNIESRMSEIIMAINRTYSIFESDKLHSEHWTRYFIRFVATK
jgi:hypothetical protein